MRKRPAPEPQYHAHAKWRFLSEPSARHPPRLDAKDFTPTEEDNVAMNIVVCVKYVPDAQSDPTFNESDNTTDRLGVDGLLSELDEYALEAGLKLAESAGEESTVTVV